jgi:hypothetical protein
LRVLLRRFRELQCERLFFAVFYFSRFPQRHIEPILRFASRRCTQCAIEMLIERYTDRFRILTQFGFQQTHPDKCLDFGYV